MKLDRLLSGTFAAVSLALACGCSSTPAPTSPTPPVVSDAVAITELMSAQLPGPAQRGPKVGKTHLAPSDDEDVVDAPNEVRRDDGSRRSGGFGTTK
jgi:hypothetical protein